MAEIIAKTDPTVDIEEIQMALMTPTPEEDSEEYEMGEYQQTKVEGIAAPLVRLNGMVIMSDQIKWFSLRTDPTPAVDIDIDDQMDLSRSLDSPQSDNLLVVQILPPFDGAYKKINLRFYITKYESMNRTIRVHGEYNIAEQHNIVLEAFGQKSTYELAETIANRLKLGFASNIEGTADTRWMYSPSKELLDVLRHEVDCGGSDTQILDWWIDYWNYLNLVDIYEQYNSSGDKPKIWTLATAGVELNEKNSTEPAEVDAVISNHPSLNGTPLYVSSYQINSSTGSNLYSGTDKSLETYSMLSLNSEVTDVMDGDIHNDIFKKYEYRGEVFGDFNYLVQEALRRSFLQKMRSQTISIELNKPQLGLMRGGKVNLEWYECSSFLAEAMREQNESVSTNADNIETSDTNSPDEDDAGNAADDSWVLNKTISGQYYILDSRFEYDHRYGNMNWHHVLRLCRPAIGVETYMQSLDPKSEQSEQ